MALSDKFRKKTEHIQSERERLAMERARSGVERLMQSEQFKLSAFSLPESQMAVNAIVESTVKSCLDPRAEFIDTLRAKGFRQAEIRATVSNLFLTYCCGNEQNIAENTSYEEKLVAVAGFVRQHQELYNTLDPANLRR